MAAASAFALSACHSHVGPLECTAFPSGSTATASTSVACSSCSVFNATGAVDGDFNSFAYVEVGSGTVTGTTTVTGTAPSGTVFPAGSRAEALVSADGDFTNVTLTLTTYLSGTQQETAVLAGASGTPAISTAERSYSFQTTKNFDSVAFEVQRAGGGGGSEFSSSLYELCH